MRQSFSPADESGHRKCLIVSSCHDERQFFVSLLSRLGWRCLVAGSCRDAGDLLEEQEVHVAVVEEELAAGGCVEVLGPSSSREHPPRLVVTSRYHRNVARIWPGIEPFYVLLKPFDRQEATNVITMAWLAWNEDSFPAPVPAAGVLRDAVATRVGPG